MLLQHWPFHFVQIILHLSVCAAEANLVLGGSKKTLWNPTVTFPRSEVCHKALRLTPKKFYFWNDLLRNPLPGTCRIQLSIKCSPVRSREIWTNYHHVQSLAHKQRLLGYYGNVQASRNKSKLQTCLSCWLEYFETAFSSTMVNTIILDTTGQILNVILLI